MKELSVEQKAQRYDESLEIARQYWNDRVMPIGTNFKLERMFPELAESEDEKIRKALRERIIRYDPNNEILIKEEGISKKQFLAWLEKQGEQKPIVIIPKFRVGDIIRHKEQGFTCKIIAVDTEYRLSGCNGNHLPFDSQDAYELVEQKPTDEEMKELLHTEYEKGRADAIAEMQKPWSEEDLYKIENALLGTYAVDTATRILNKIKSLRPQSQWKPSDMELEVLKLAAEKDGICLMKLYEQLKKLREE